MNATCMTVWFDQAGDFLEVLFDSRAPGFFLATEDGRVLEKVDETGRLLGFSVLSVSGYRTPVALSLAAPASPSPQLLPTCCLNSPDAPLTDRCTGI